jgi:VIT1/CCC1 family predicted Fe2+/Mn2+ transporter
MYLAARASSADGAPGSSMRARRGARTRPAGRGELDELLERVTEESDRAPCTARSRARSGGEPPRETHAGRRHGAIASFFLVFSCSVPAALPFVFFDEAWTALRFSNAILIGLLFVVGYHWARHTNLPPKRVGFALMVGGLALVLMAIALGG